MASSHPNRRTLLLAGAAAIAPFACRAQDAAPLAVWVSAAPYPFLDKPVNITMAGGGQVGVEGSNGAAGTGAIIVGGVLGALVAPAMSLREAERALVNHPALATVTLDTDFAPAITAGPVSGVARSRRPRHPGPGQPARRGS